MGETKRTTDRRKTVTNAYRSVPRLDNGPHRTQITDSTTNHWEDLEHRPSQRKPKGPKPKIRCPVVITSWFSEVSSSDDTEDTEVNSDWNEVDRKKKNEEKRIRLMKKRKDLQTWCATKAGHMIGLGPISMEEVMILVDQGHNFEQAKVKAFRNCLVENLGYIEEEVRDIGIAETKFAKNEDILYAALKKQETVKEMHIWKAESQNDDVLVRSYIPPNLYERFTVINQICKDLQYKDLKTQLIFGKSDIEVITKYHGQPAEYRLVRLENIMDTSCIPPFDHRVK